MARSITSCSTATQTRCSVLPTRLPTRGCKWIWERTVRFARRTTACGTMSLVVAQGRPRSIPRVRPTVTHFETGDSRDRTTGRRGRPCATTPRTNPSRFINQCLKRTGPSTDARCATGGFAFFSQSNTTTSTIISCVVLASSSTATWMNPRTTPTQKKKKLHSPHSPH